MGEDTALLVTGNSMRVLGVNGISLFDLRDAQVSGDWPIAGVRWSYLVAGDIYPADLWQITAGSPALVPHQRVAMRPTADVFGSYALLDSALDLADAALSSQTTGTTAESPAFVVTLAKGPQFRANTRSFGELTLAIAPL